jgi:hypothetical protein
LASPLLPVPGDAPEPGCRSGNPLRDARPVFSDFDADARLARVLAALWQHGVIDARWDPVGETTAVNLTAFGRWLADEALLTEYIWLVKSERGLHPADTASRATDGVVGDD